MAEIVVTPDSVLAGEDAAFYQGTAGVAVTAGQAVTLDPATKRLVLADSNAAVGLATVKGISLHAAAVGQPLRVQTNGTVTVGGTTVGVIYVLSGTPGGIAPAADQAAGMYTSVIGVGAPTGGLKLSLINSGQQM